MRLIAMQRLHSEGRVYVNPGHVVLVQPWDDPTRSGAIGTTVQLSTGSTFDVKHSVNKVLELMERSGFLVIDP